MLGLFSYELQMGGDVEEVNIYRTVQRRNIRTKSCFHQDNSNTIQKLSTGKRSHQYFFQITIQSLDLRFFLFCCLDHTMASEKSSINCCKVGRFTAIKLESDDCKKVTCCESACGDVCNNYCVPLCLYYGCKKDCSKVACCKSVCSNCCVPSCHHHSCKAVGCKRSEHLHSFFIETSCGPVCKHLTSCHDHNIKHDCRCRRTCGNEVNTCFPVINLKTSSEWDEASCKPASVHNVCQ